MADYGGAYVGGKRLLKVRLGSKVIWEAPKEDPPKEPEPEKKEDE